MSNIFSVISIVLMGLGGMSILVGMYVLRTERSARHAAASEQDKGPAVLE